MAESLQPLRVPAGWRVGWNTLFDLDPTEDNVRRGYFGGSSLFAAVNEGCRLSIDVEWRPEDDPSGEYHLKVEYAPWLRTARGRRRKDVPLDFSNTDVVYECRTRNRAELVRELEAVLANPGKWTEGS